jgi:hypothetical protein
MSKQQSDVMACMFLAHHPKASTSFPSTAFKILRGLPTFYIQSNERPVTSRALVERKRRQSTCMLVLAQQCEDIISSRRCHNPGSIS